MSTKLKYLWLFFFQIFVFFLHYTREAQEVYVYSSKLVTFFLINGMIMFSFMEWSIIPQLFAS